MRRRDPLLAALLVIAGCSGEQRFDDAAVADVTHSDVATDAPADARFDVLTDAASDAATDAEVPLDVPPLFADAVTEPPGPETRALALGGAHTCALLADGSVRCFGRNDRGQLGDGSTEPRRTPVVVTALSGATQIAAGGSHTCALVAAGEVRCFGDNRDGQLGASVGESSSAPVVVRDGASALAGVRQLVAGANHTCARLSDGTARCFGRNDHGQLGVAPAPSSAALVTVLRPGTTDALTGIEELASGANHTCARTTGGAVVCWGASDAGQLGSLGTLPTAARIFAGGRGTCAVDPYEVAQCWGAHDVGQLGTGKQAPGMDPLPLTAPNGAEYLEHVAEVALGTQHGCVRVTNGRVYCFGVRARVGTDIEDLPWIPHPAQRSVMRFVSALAAGDGHTCAVEMPGTQVRCWGDNADGQLGDGTTTARETPVRVAW